MTPSRPDQAVPRHARLLSNGRYSVLLTSAGGGYSRWRDLALTRWREDPTRDAWGSHVLLRDVDDQRTWAAGKLPIGQAPERYASIFPEGLVRIVRDDGGLTTTLEVAVADDRDAELRRVTLENRGTDTRTVELTSYAELVLGPAGADAAHPAFSKMFVETEWVEDAGVLLATRRRSSPDDPVFWAGHFAVVADAATDVSPAEAGVFETDRARFLGRGRSVHNARVMTDGASLSNSAGCVLDPIFSVRRRVRVAPGAGVGVAFWTVAADSRESVLALCASLRSPDVARRVLASAPAHAMALNHSLGVEAVAANRYDDLVAPILYADAKWRAPISDLGKGVGGPPTLWGSAISGDRPIVLMRIEDKVGLESVDDLLLAQRYWQSRRLGVDCVLLNAASGSAGDSLQKQLLAALEKQKDRLNEPAELAKAEAFVLRDADTDKGVRDGLATVARVVLDAASGLAAPARAAIPMDTIQPAITDHVGRPANVTPIRPPNIHSDAPDEFANGFGAFSPTTREYVVTLDGDRCTPAPWVNIVANPSFGFMVSCEGGGCAWSINSQQNTLTPWPNDPVSDSPHDVLYLRDEDDGKFWSATALPVRVDSAIYTATHGKGYSRFTNDAHGIELDLLQFVPSADSVKLSRLRIYNASGRLRRLSLTAYVEWALTANGVNSAPFVVTSIEVATGALFARNAWRPEFAGRTAFLDLAGAQTSATGDRTEFLGVLGDVGRPASMVDTARLSGRVGAGLDPCGALRTTIDLASDEAVEFLVLLGDAASESEARKLIDRWRSADLESELAAVVDGWREMLDTIIVKTPDASMDIMLNDWLLYQTLACRVWARTAYYQASGAYGFRDQLQDVMALCVARPEIARAQIIRSASRQFLEGDVQHWWLPPSGRGIRTRMTDDRLWLPYVAMHFVEVTGDNALFDERVAFVEGEALKDGQNDAFFEPAVSKQTASVYEHCARAVDVSLTLGEHNLPLFGTGDWNDGMNRVGEKGRGESVWLGWFLIAVIEGFIPHAQARGDSARVARWRHCSATVKAALETAGWDGAWYRRGYYDDGTPLGSADSVECKIDQIAQSWSVLSGVADAGHTARAMASLKELLIREDDRIAPLLTPPFDRGPEDPGYIKGYPPGLRENGGQYTHGATWSIFAFAELGHGDDATNLFSILNPVTHACDADRTARYKVEPYVTCGDLYSVDPLVGRGGWTWYSGSAGWLYRAGMEAVLGFRMHGDELEIDPAIPASWPGYELTFSRRGANGNTTRYELVVENPASVHCGVSRAEMDGKVIERHPPEARGIRIPMSDDGGVHRVRVVLG